MKGIYRVNGAKSRVEKLCQAFENGKHLVELSELYPHDISNVLKLYLRQVSCFSNLMIPKMFCWHCINTAGFFSNLSIWTMTPTSYLIIQFLFVSHLSIYSHNSGVSVNTSLLHLFSLILSSAASRAAHPVPLLQWFYRFGQRKSEYHCGGTGGIAAQSHLSSPGSGQCGTQPGSLQNQGPAEAAATSSLQDTTVPHWTSAPVWQLQSNAFLLNALLLVIIMRKNPSPLQCDRAIGGE